MRVFIFGIKKQIERKAFTEYENEELEFLNFKESD